jgi:hypothetical protein
METRLPGVRFRGISSHDPTTSYCTCFTAGNVDVAIHRADSHLTSERTPLVCLIAISPIDKLRTSHMDDKSASRTNGSCSSLKTWFSATSSFIELHHRMEQYCSFRVLEIFAESAPSSLFWGSWSRRVPSLGWDCFGPRCLLVDLRCSKFFLPLGFLRIADQYKQLQPAEPACFVVI